MNKFLVCKHCGNLVGMINDSGAKIVCCGEPMQVLTPNTTEAAVEKHLPEVTVHENVISVQIGSTEHPMTAEHYISWVYLETESGGQRKAFQPGDTPKTTFTLQDDKPVAVYAYCNLHGLWKTDL